MQEVQRQDQFAVQVDSDGRLPLVERVCPVCSLRILEHGVRQRLVGPRRVRSPYCLQDFEGVT